MSPYPSVAVISAPEPDAAETPEPGHFGGIDADFHQVDELQPATVMLASELDTAETVAIAPDASLRYIVLAPTKAAGEQEATALGITPVAIVTPRSTDAARGIAADRVLATDGLTDDQKTALLHHALPSLETT